MNSFSNMQISDKTFSGFQIKRNQDTINKFNNSMKDTQNSIDVNMFEQTTLQDDDELQGIGNIDFNTDKNAQKQITIQTNKTNVLASSQAYLDANTANETNPILHDGELRRQQRSKKIRMQDEVTVVSPGQDTQSQFQQMLATENSKLLKKQSKHMVDNRVQFTPKPIDLEYSKKVDVERPLLKQTIDNSMKFQNDYNNFQAKGVREAKPEKRIPVVPLMGLQMQQNQVQDTEVPETVFRSKGNRMGPIAETGGVKTTISFNDVNVGRLIMMPKEIGKFVIQNTYGRPQDSYSQPLQSLETIVPQQKNNFQNYSHTLITGIKNIFAPKPMMTQDNTRGYVHQASNNIPQNRPQISGTTDLKPITTNKPNFHNLATQSRQAQNYGPNIPQNYGPGEQNMYDMFEGLYQ